MFSRRNFLALCGFISNNASWRGKETAGPSTSLRSGRDDNSVVPPAAGSVDRAKANSHNRIVIPTGAQRSGGTCGFFPSP